MPVRPNRIVLAVITAGLIAATVAPTGADAGPPVTPAGVFPTILHLPDGFQPEGIAIGSHPIAYVGSLTDGDLVRVNLVTGVGERFSNGTGTPSVGLKIDNIGRLFVAGGPAGDARVVSADSGEVLASYQLATGADQTFVNDVVLTRSAAWFTDSMRPVLYRLPLDAHGQLPTQAQVVTVRLKGDWQQVAGFNANGIARTPDGSALLVVNSTTGKLFHVDPATGVASVVDLGGETLVNGDGLLVSGPVLYAVQNQLNMVAAVRLNAGGTAGTVVNRYTGNRFDVPTTVARFGGRLYLVNARFTTPATPDTTYTAEAAGIADVLGR